MGGRVHLKLLFVSKAVQLNHHVKQTLQEYICYRTIIGVVFNDIFGCKNNEELKK